MYFYSKVKRTHGDIKKTWEVINEAAHSSVQRSNN